MGSNGMGICSAKFQTKHSPRVTSTLLSLSRIDSIMVNMSEDTTICDPDGDVKLIVQKAKLDGGGKHFILVSSKILCLTSIVFRAMLGPSWKEGSELAAR